MLFAANSVYVAHVGDSRVYRFRDGKLEQLTEDHSLLNDYIKMKKLTPEEIENFPHKNVIVRALGMKDTVKVDVGRIEPQDGRHLPALLRRALGDGERRARWRRILRSTPELKEACGKLIELANAAGGNDNVTCILARYRLA